MSEPILIPFWLFLLLACIAVLAVVDRILIPSTRWFLRRRINRVIDEISTRLAIEIRPFQVTKRQVLIDRLVYDPLVVEAIHAHAREHGMPLEVAQKRVVAYAREIVPSFNAYLYFRIGYWLAKKVARLLYRVRVDLMDSDSLAVVDPEATVVFVMNHRSNMDYILVAFLAAERTTLSYAVGEWARIWPLQTLIRAMGAFFVRRNSGDPLYRRVLERYIHKATREGVCQAVFPEGGLSRNGEIQKPKLGILDYMLRGFDPEKHRDIVFVPVGVNYDRTIEDRSLLRFLDPAANRRSLWFVFRTTLGFIRRSLWLMVLSRWRRYGYACVNFGTPVSAASWCRQNGVDFSALDRRERFLEIEKLAGRLMDGIGQVVPVLPVSLVSTVFLQSADTPLSILQVETRANRLIKTLRTRGAPVFDVPQSTRAHTIARAVDTLNLRRLVAETSGKYRMVEKEGKVLQYYAGAIAHWLDGTDQAFIR